MIFLIAISKFFGLIRSPQQQWKMLRDEVQEEPNTVISDYALPLILISNLTMLAFAGESKHSVIVYGIAGFVLPFLVLTLTNGVVLRLARMFEAKADKMDVTKLVTYASAPLWLGMIFNPFETLSFVGWLGGLLYSLVLYSHGLQVLLEVPKAKQRSFLAIISMVVFLLNGISILVLSASYRVFVVGIGGK
jgi:hypothetical protein